MSMVSDTSVYDSQSSVASFVQCARAVSERSSNSENCFFNVSLCLKLFSSVVQCIFIDGVTAIIESLLFLLVIEVDFDDCHDSTADCDAFLNMMLKLRNEDISAAHE